MSSRDPSPRVQASEADWALLTELASFDIEDDLTESPIDDLLAPSEEVVRVSRRIAGQYVEVLARFSASVFGRDAGRVSTEQVGTAVEAMLRLAQAAEDADQTRLLQELLALVGPVTSGPRNSRPRQSALARLRNWLPRFATTLEPADGERLARLVEWDRDAAPLLEELAAIHGIGPKRLQRLYSAGLFTVDAVAGAHPADIVAVTGIPLQLAEDVVRATRAYAVEERERCLSGMLERVHRLRRILRAVPAENGSVADAAAAALREVERALMEIEPLPGGVPS
ncbi:MAG: hypothetical protein H6737_14940 [Alphaproteobacteria bacterium]|nr:hypothetical protein [Alphaproteobacteria bacterium]